MLLAALNRYREELEAAEFDLKCCQRERGYNLARAEAAEDRAEAAEQKLREIAQFTLKTNTRAEAAEAKAARLKKALDSLFDAHYGMSYHHCGDGDGLNPEEAAEIVALVKE